MKFLFFILPASGHLNPTLAVAKALVERGDEVIYYLPEREAPRVRNAGAKVHVLGEQFASPESKLAAQGVPDGSASLGRFIPVIMHALADGLRGAPAVAQQVRAEAPDCIVYDPMCTWGRLVAEMVGARRAVFNTTYVLAADSKLVRLMRAQMRPNFAILRAMARLLWASERLHWRYGTQRVVPPAIFTATEGLNLVPMPKRFHPDADQLDGRYLFIGPSLMEQRDTHDFPLAQLEGKPTLYISLGTTPLGRRPDFYRACFEAFGGTRWQVVLALSGMDPSTLGPVPENFLVRARVPQLEVLQRAQVFITHGGMGSTMEGVWFGVPLVVVPQMPEQALSATRIEELGGGVHLPPENATPDALRRAVEKVSEEPGYKQRILELQAAAREAGGAQRAAEALREYAARKG